MTPFIAILRDCANKGVGAENMLIFSNATGKGVFMAQELGAFCGGNILLTLTQEEHPDYYHGRINKAMLKEHIKDWSKYFYNCGPKEMVMGLKKELMELGIITERIITEDL